MVVEKEKILRADPSGSFAIGPFSLLNVFIKGKLALVLFRRILPSLWWGIAFPFASWKIETIFPFHRPRERTSDFPFSHSNLALLTARSLSTRICLAQWEGKRRGNWNALRREETESTRLVLCRQPFVSDVDPSWIRTRISLTKKSWIFGGVRISITGNGACNLVSPVQQLAWLSSLNFCGKFSRERFGEKKGISM